jgi:hypothetical protein
VAKATNLRPDRVEAHVVDRVSRYKILATGGGTGGDRRRPAVPGSVRLDTITRD